MKNMKNIKIFPAILLFLLAFNAVNAQVVTTDPAFPSASKAVTIYFNATEGSGGLADYAGDVYAHTGVITDKSTSGTDWKYVKTNWGQNTAETKLTRESANLYSLVIGPSIREYYGVPATDTIKNMAFVFRSSDNTLEGKAIGGDDILVPLYESGFNVSVISPDHYMLLEPGSQLDFEAAASESADLELYLSGSLVSSITSSTISYTFDFDTPGDFWLKVSATLDTETVYDSVFVHVLGNQPTGALPEGIKDGINYVDDNTVQLVLYAPGKDYVFVVGDFNNWTPASTSRMTLDQNRYWITIDGLTPGKEYAYQYLVDGEIIIADPYTEKILDPANDQWISSSTYPDLKTYPTGLTIGLTSIVETGQAAFNWEHKDFAAPEQENLVIYELLVRDFIAAHDWKTLTDTLDYFSNLGINAIELMPINEFEGNESWGYNPSFYFAPDKYYGPKEDLQAFIDACHSRGIAVIMDIALNHSYSLSPLVQLYFNSSTFKVTADNPWYNVDSPNTAYSWGYDFNHESPATQAFVDRVTSHWLTEYDMDGFRFDFTKGFTNTPGDGGAYDAARISILKRMSDHIRTVSPDAYIILEHFADNSEEKILSDHGMMIWGNINYNYNEATMGYNDGGKSNFSWISYKNRGWNDPHLVGYMESHDEERLMFKNLEYGNSSGSYTIKELNTALERIELAAAFFFTIPGPKMIWQFGELGYDYSIEENGRVGNKPIRWDYLDVPARKHLYDVFAALIEMKTTEPALATSDYVLSLGSAAKRIELNHSDMDVRVLGNFDVVTQTVDPNFSKTGTWYEFFSGTELNVTAVNDPISLEAGEYRLYSTKKIDIQVDARQEQLPLVQNSGLLVYPVPASEKLFVEYKQEMTGIVVLDLNGRILREEPAASVSHHLDISTLQPGIYLLKIKSETGSAAYTRFVKR